MEKAYADALACVAEHLDTPDALALLRTCWTVYDGLANHKDFWKYLCENEGLNRPCYDFLKKDEDKDKQSYSGEVLHDVNIPPGSPVWRKVFLRGAQMRRNVGLGGYQDHRLYATGKDHAPVKVMSSNDDARWNKVLKSVHEASPFASTLDEREWQEGMDPGTLRFASNEKYLVFVVRRKGGTWSQVIFVCGWEDGRNPKFLFSHDTWNQYPDGGCLQDQFFVHKDHLVLLPNSSINGNVELSDLPTETHRSMIRSHDLRSADMVLAGTYDFPEGEGERRRCNIVHGGNIGQNQGGSINVGIYLQENARLLNIGDLAAVICRVTPAREFAIFIFSLPDCRLLSSVGLSHDLTGNPEMPLKSYGLQGVVVIDDTVMCCFGNLLTLSGGLLFIDFEEFHSEGTIGSYFLALESAFKNGCAFEDLLFVNRRRLAHKEKFDQIVIRDLIFTPGTTTVASRVLLVIPPPPGISTNGSSRPHIRIPKSGKMIVARYRDRRDKLYSFRAGSTKAAYTVDIPNHDPLAQVYWTVSEDYIAVKVSNKINLWGLETGTFLGSIVIPGNYGLRWRGEEGPYKDFYIAENGSIIGIASKEGMPGLADVIHFW